MSEASSAGNARGKQRGRPWPKGTSGNPNGKAPGTRHLATRAIEQFLDGEAEELTRKCVEMALTGDTTAMRLCLERLSPVRKGRPVSLSLPPISGADDLLKAFGAVVASMAEGEITPEEAAAVAGVLEAKRKTIETADIERRLAALEQRAGNGKS